MSSFLKETIYQLDFLKEAGKSTKYRSTYTLKVFFAKNYYQLKKNSKLIKL